MKITVKRQYRKTDYTIGNLYIDGKWFCNTLEDTDRGLCKEQPLSHIVNIKRFGNTAIPIGEYCISLDVVSPKFSRSEKYSSIAGKLPRILDVPGFEGILIHIGNTSRDTDGCILVGKNRIAGRVCESTATFFELYKLFKEADSRGEEIIITIK